MISPNTINPKVLDFLVELSKHKMSRSKLRHANKEKVLETARELGYVFTEEQYDHTLFGFEEQLAKNIGEEFSDPTFTLWNLMWGKTYLDYLLDGIVPIITLFSKKYNLS